MVFNASLYWQSWYLCYHWMLVLASLVVNEVTSSKCVGEHFSLYLTNAVTGLMVMLHFKTGVHTC